MPRVEKLLHAVYKPRDCLRCDRSFLSWGPENRLCQACRDALRELPTEEEEYELVLHRLD